MDPEAALLNAISHIADSEWEDAVESLGAYREWREKGGFEPQDVEYEGQKLPGDLLAVRLMSSMAFSDRVCPFCAREEDAEYENVEVDGATAVQQATCKACDRSWREVYIYRECLFDGEKIAETHPLGGETNPE